ncbi:hypothetical protein MMC26_006120 [Xylographa opegraphella]|nr:hypothetical protein [Xylographa opegraphella]
MAEISPQEIQYQEENINDNASGGLYASAITMMVVTATTVILRLLCKRKLNAKITVDDYCIILALVSPLGPSAPIEEREQLAYHDQVLIYGLCIELILCAQFGGGKHAITVPIPQQVHMLQMIFAFELTYASTATAIKMSILLLLRRIFPASVTPVAWRAVWYFVVAWVLLWLVGCGCATIFQCLPVSFYWNQITGDTNGFCVNEYIFLAGNAALNIASDIMILVLPMPIVWRLHIKKSQKLAISSIFLLGGFVCLASVIRYTYLKQVIPVDVTYSNQPAGIWSLVEMAIGLVCACLPVMRPLLQYLIPGWVTTLADSFDKKSYSWRNSPYTPQRASAKTNPTSDSSSRPTLAEPESVRMSRVEPVPTKSGGNYSREGKDNSIVKSISYSTTWSHDDDEEKALHGAYQPLP